MCAGSERGSERLSESGGPSSQGQKPAAPAVSFTAVEPIGASTQQRPAMPQHPAALSRMGRSGATQLHTSASASGSSSGEEPSRASFAAAAASAPNGASVTALTIAALAADRLSGRASMRDAARSSMDATRRMSMREEAQARCHPAAPPHTSCRSTTPCTHLHFARERAVLAAQHVTSGIDVAMEACRRYNATRNTGPTQSQMQDAQQAAQRVMAYAEETMSTRTVPLIKVPGRGERNEDGSFRRAGRDGRNSVTSTPRTDAIYGARDRDRSRDSPRSAGSVTPHGLVDDEEAARREMQRREAAARAARQGDGAGAAAEAQLSARSQRIRDRSQQKQLGFAGARKGSWASR